MNVFLQSDTVLSSAEVSLTLLTQMKGCCLRSNISFSSVL